MSSHYTTDMKKDPVSDEEMVLFLRKNPSFAPLRELRVALRRVERTVQTLLARFDKAA